MSLTSFLEELFETGRVTVQDEEDWEPDDLRSATQLLKSAEQVWRTTLAFDAPVPHAPAMLWAAQSVYRAAQWIALRNYDERSMERKSPPAPFSFDEDPSVVYSVDLCLRFLPDLVRLATSPMEGDPLIATLRQWARDWPLSSIGVADLDRCSESALRLIFSHPALRTLYIDRVIQREDHSRLANDRVADGVRDTMGLHGALAPALHHRLSHHSGETRT